MNNCLSDLERRIGKQSNFENIIVDRIKSKGYSTFYKAVRKDLTNEDEIFSKYFNSDEIIKNETDSSKIEMKICKNYC